jgi:hypothetical protein
MLPSNELRYQIERDMREANFLYRNWQDTTYGHTNSPGKIEKLRSFASRRVLWALDQGLVVVIMPSEYSTPYFEWAKDRNGNGNGYNVFAGRPR